MKSINSVAKLTIFGFGIYLCATWTMVLSGAEGWQEFMAITFPPVLVITSIVIVAEMSRRD